MEREPAAIRQGKLATAGSGWRRRCERVGRNAECTPASSREAAADETVRIPRKKGNKMTSKQHLANEIGSCLAAGCSGSVGASGEVYAGQDSLHMINGDPIIYRAQAGRCALNKRDMLALAEKALEAIGEFEEKRSMAISHE
jgi:hypothetical protein